MIGELCGRGNISNIFAKFDNVIIAIMKMSLSLYCHHYFIFLQKFVRLVPLVIFYIAKFVAVLKGNCKYADKPR